MLRRLWIFPSTVLLLTLSTPMLGQTGQSALTGVDKLHSRRVIASASEKSIRFSFLGELIQMRLEVVNSSGATIFDSGFKQGNVIDWPGSVSKDKPLADGAYLCIVTVKDSSGQLTRKQAIAVLLDGSVSVTRHDASTISPAQAQIAGAPADEDVSVTIVDSTEAMATAVLAHDGNSTQLVSGNGGFSIGSGDFFANKVLEHIRITAQGNMGIGVSNPQARLDVAGMIRATQGIVFPDGSIQYSAASKTYGDKSSLPGSFSHSTSSRLIAGGQQHLDAAGTGTVNFLAKWAETGGVGTLTNSAIFETNGSVGIGTSDPQTGLDYHNPQAPFFTRDFPTNPGNAVAGLQLGLSGAGSRNVNVGPSFLFFSENSAGTKSFLGRVSGIWENPTAGSEAGSIFFQTRASSADVNALTERMRITAAGNVGIGTTAPAAVLDVQREGSTAETARFTTFGATNEILGRASAGTRAAPTATPLGRIMLQLGATGHDGTNFVANPKATIQLTASEDWTGSSQGTLIRFNTTASGTTTTNTKMIITDDGSVGIGTAAPNKHLHVFGASDQQIAIESSDVNGRQWTLQSSRGTNNGRFEIVDRTANTSRFSILDSGNVGIGTTAPTARLDVNGDVKVNGAISIAAQTRHASIHATSFTLVQGAEWGTGGGNIFVANDGNVFNDPMQVGAAVTLPDGAVVTRVRAFVEDDDNGSGQNIRVQLKRMANGGTGTVDVMADVSSSGTGVLVISTTSISLPTVDNGNFSYFIEASSPGASNNTFRLFSVVIDYTVTTPLP